MRTSLRLNNDLEPGQLIDLARAAEAAGFDQLWVSHDLMLRSAPVLLGALATSTSRISLGVGIVNPYTMHPAEIAMMASTMQELSGGRFLLGLAAGAADFLGWVGIEQPKPLTAVREALRSLRALLNGGKPLTIEGSGSGWTDQAYLRVPPQPTPIYVGAMSPRMVEFAGAEADGVLALLFPPEHFSTVAAQVSAGAAAAGRSLDGAPDGAGARSLDGSGAGSPGAFDLPACVWLSIDHDQRRAERALAHKLAYYGSAFSPYLLGRAGLSRADFAEVDAALRRGDPEAAADAVTPRMLALGIAGAPDAVIARCASLRDLGARHLSFGPPLGDDPVAAVELLGDTVLPVVRGWNEQ
ncbi:LLM class flavin-dependent oxidoreductase [Herbiconiux daphne]|uniref:LLM class flavin-dependent oxidoreductase n=1 Tax=Herbiconiux daphne TaxID=2970914 RepID=A0ABT2GW91_9MICO|nr:LLM class flavin-dependent oxidoreductase [Herbiconiux daphne]MCS5732227.1 LLM class flavin-dependent oxidoreductase [Herbiconiux daphne]